MPIPYELSIIIRKMPKNEIPPLLKRVANTIFSTGGVIRKIDNLGTRALPYKTSSHGSVHREGSYFVFDFYSPIASLHHIDHEINRDVDIIRSRIFRSNVDEEPFECTIEEEMKPAPYRSEVIKMLEDAKKKEMKKKYKYNTGLDYYPFQK